MEVSPVCQIKQEKTLDGDANKEVKVVKGKGKKKEKAPDYLNMLEFDQEFYEMKLTLVHTPHSLFLDID